MKTKLLIVLIFALSNLSCGILGWSTLTIHNKCSTVPVQVTCSYYWESAEDEYGYSETYSEYWTMDLSVGESEEVTIYGDTGTRIYLSADNGNKSADFSYTVSINGDKTVSIYDSDFY